MQVNVGDLCVLCYCVSVLDGSTDVLNFCFDCLDSVKLLPAVNVSVLR